MGYSGEDNYLNPLKLNTILHNSEGLCGFSTKMLISFAADSQNQRHRKSYGIRPYMLDYFKNRDIKYFVPQSIRDNDDALAIYREIMDYMFRFVKENIDSSDDYIYLLPNAYSFEIIERNDFNSFVHKAQMRMCLNAQEELRNIVYDMVYSLYREGVNVKMLGPICVGRADHNIKPYCTEGPRYCGVKMWKPENFFKQFKHIPNYYENIDI